ncbi:hypothetical protein QZH41_009144 [Actinostola sp. cb2023]|nr:hypothetical protein QZH41_009144 [Actinostola sp. cb2023]
MNPEKDEQINVKGIRISLALLEAEPIRNDSKAAVQHLSAGFALVTFGTMLWTVLGITCIDKLAKVHKFEESCSFAPPCDRDHQDNIKAVNSFVLSLHGNISCYYNPADHQQVILRRNSHVMDLFHALFWPFLFVFVGLIMFYKYFRSLCKGSYS